MHSGHDPIRAALGRRAFLVAGGIGFAGLSLPTLVRAQPAASTAKSCILIWLSGGASHISMWYVKYNQMERAGRPGAEF
jgi:hypothetical protein